MPGRTALRRRAIVTGAAGGMGGACARAFGETMDLVLTDLAADRLEIFSEGLKREGYRVAAAYAGDLCDETLCAQLAEAGAGGAGLGVLVHAAAISQAMGSWEAILRVNLLGTVTLLAAIEPILMERSVAVLIASMAGHMSPVLVEADAILDDPLAHDFMERIGPIVHRLSASDARGPSPIGYAFSKRAIMRICEQRSASWADKGARIVSISPGMIWTPMGQREVAENFNAAAVVEATPVGRWGTVMDIAAAARFLASDAASFITGTDLRVDGGVTPHLRATRRVVSNNSKPTDAANAAPN